MRAYNAKANDVSDAYKRLKRVSAQSERSLYGCIRLRSGYRRCRSFTPSAKATAAQFLVRLRRNVSHLRSYLRGPALDALLAVLRKRT